MEKLKQIVCQYRSIKINPLKSEFYLTLPLQFQGDARIFHRHPKVLRHEGDEAQLRQVLDVQERQQRTASFHPSPADARDVRLPEEQIRNGTGGGRNLGKRLARPSPPDQHPELAAVLLQRPLQGQQLYSRLETEDHHPAILNCVQKNNFSFPVFRKVQSISLSFFKMCPNKPFK